MSKLAKVILAIVAGLAVLFAIALLLVNVYVQSAPMQRRIERRLSEALDIPVQIRRTSVSALGGLTLAGVTIPTETPDAPLLDARDVSASLRLLPLLRGQLVINEIALNFPVVTWRQTEGKWQLPHPPQPPASGPTAEAAPTAPELAVEPVPSPAEQIPPMIGKPSSTPEKSGFQVEVRRLSITDGSFDFQQEDGSSFARLQGVNISGDIAPEGSVSGEATTAELVFGHRHRLTELKTSFSYREDLLEIPALTARMADGRVRGNFELEPERSGTPFQMKLDFEDVNLAKLLASAGVTSATASGTMSGFLELGGKVRKRKDLEGRGSLSIQNGLLEQYPLFQVIGRALRVDELDQMKLSTAEARYTIQKGNLLIDSLVLKSQNIQLDAQGRIDRDNDLDLAARLTLSPRITRQLPEFVEDYLTPVAGSDRRYLDFKIGGTLANPKTNLGDLDMLQKLKSEAVDFLKQLWK